MSQTAAESLALCLLEMADTETNPVLLLIDPEITLEENKKYPAGLLQFNQLGWRAYYHCHPATRAGNHRFKGEHGHFHIFIRTQTEPEEWSHLVALAMDNMGQPLGWFTVNHWVTGETWESADVLIEHLNSIAFDKQKTVVESWLLSLLALDIKNVESIIFERDKILEEKSEALSIEEAKSDKDVYLLSERELNLRSLLFNK